MSDDFTRLLGNLDDPTREVIAGIAIRLAVIRQEQWTGSITIQIHTSQGGIGDMQVSRAEVVRIGSKKRKIRSAGVV